MDIVPHQKEFWQFKLPHILTIITMIAGLILFMSRFEHRVSEIENTQKSMLETDGRLTATIERMDAQGTYASQRAIMRDSETAVSNTRRIEAMEGVMRDINPKVERLNTNMDWLINSLKQDGTLKRDGHP